MVINVGDEAGCRIKVNVGGFIGAKEVSGRVGKGGISGIRGVKGGWEGWRCGSGGGHCGEEGWEREAEDAEVAAREREGRKAHHLSSKLCIGDNWYGRSESGRKMGEKVYDAETLAESIV